MYHPGGARFALAGAFSVTCLPLRLAFTRSGTIRWVVSVPWVTADGATSSPDLAREVVSTLKRREYRTARGAASIFGRTPRKRYRGE